MLQLFDETSLLLMLPVTVALNKSDCFKENKNKAKIFRGWKSSKCKNIKAYQDFAVSYKQNILI